MQRNQQGFTLIELVIVIVILGILSAFALPRFADLSGDAERAAVEGARGAVASASSIVRSAALAGGAEPDGTVELEGTTIDLVNGFAAAQDDTNDGILEAAQIDENDYDNVDTDTDGEVTVELGDCSFSYTDSEAEGTAPEITQVDCSTN